MKEHFDNYLFRCSRLHEIMTNSRGSKDIGDTAQAYLDEIFIFETEGRTKPEIYNKYCNKGIIKEETSIQLLSILKDKPYSKNSTYISNSFICGTPDIIDADMIIDTKTCWDRFTFQKKKRELGKDKPDYYAQMQGYMELTNTNTAIIAYCLVDTPEEILKEELKYINDIFEQKNIIKNHTFDDIELHKKAIQVEIYRDRFFIDQLYERIDLCRKILKKML